MTDVAVDTLRLRGPHARRLTSVAAGPLPAALERALAAVGDVTLDRVEVILDLDPDDYDDATLAVLWADAIRAGVLAAGAPARPGPVAGTAPGADPAPRRSWGTAEVLVAARAWLADGGPGLPPELLALGESETARAVTAAAGTAEWRELVAALARHLGLAKRPEPGSAEPSPAGPLEQSPRHDAESTDADPAAARSDSYSWALTPGPAARPEPGQAIAVQQALATVAGLAEASATDVGPTTLTRAAGLVLLYPWLAEHCRRAEELHPRLDPLDVREAALAALVDVDLTAVDDPLVALLAGRDDPVPGRLRPPLPGQDEVTDSAAVVLRSFAALLPGFETSTPAFVREAWIVRLGLVDRRRDPVLLTATTHPLDVLLPLLPYPVGLVKLPWTPPLSVRFRP